MFDMIRMIKCASIRYHLLNNYRQNDTPSDGINEVSSLFELVLPS